MGVKRKRLDSKSEISSTKTLNVQEDKKTDAPAKPIALITKSSDLAFPRGGASILTALEVKEAGNEATRDVLFESSKKSESTDPTLQPPKKKVKSKSKKSPKVAKETNEKKVQIRGLSFKLLAPDTYVIGQVAQINASDVSISLANNLIGYLPITSISEQITKNIMKLEESEDEDDKSEENELELPELSSLFSIGQWVRAVIVSTEREQKESKKMKKRIELSIEPSKVNGTIEDNEMAPGTLLQTSIQSLEDHGAILDTGFEGITSFISKKELTLANFDFDSLIVGQPLLVTVISKPSNGRTVTATVLHTSKKAKLLSTISSVESVIPGLLVEALITEVRSKGLVTKIFGLVDGTIDLFQLGCLNEEDLSSKFKVGQKIKARIIANFPLSETKKVALSLLPHVVSLGKSWDEGTTNPSEALPVGFTIDNAVVKSVDSQLGLFLDIGVKTIGFVHISRIADKKPDVLLATDGKYKIGTSHAARILSYSFVDNLFTLSMEKKILNKKYLRIADIPVGELITGEVTKLLTTGGLLVKIFDEFVALVPECEMSDIKLINPERKFRVGSKVKGRVLKVTPESNRILLTLKRTLVNAEDEIITKFEDAKVGMRTPATISVFKGNKGVLVSFFSSTLGFLPISEVSDSFIKDPKDHFRLNQTIIVRVIEVDAEKKSIIVSCRSEELSNTQKDALDSLIPGKSIVSASIVEKSKYSIVVELKKGNLRAIIFTGHLSDGNIEQNKAIQNRLKVGSTLESLLVLDKNKSRITSLTQKESLIADAKRGKLPTIFEDIIVDKKLHGFVKSKTANGLFISFGAGLTGLAPPSLLTDTKVENPQSLFYENQSVSCRVVNTDNSKKKFLLSLTSTKSKKSKNTEGGVPVKNPVDDTISSLAEYLPGKVTKAKVHSIKANHLNVVLADNQQGIIDVSQVFDNWDDIIDKRSPLKQFKKGDILPVKVIGYHDSRNNTFLPITHKSTKQMLIELSAKKSDIETPEEHNILTLDDTKVGTIWTCFIKNEANGYIWANITPTVKGRISLLDLTSDVTKLHNVLAHYPVGSAIRCTVKEVNTKYNSVKLSGRAVEGNEIESIDDVKVGSLIPANIFKISEMNLKVQLGEKTNASCHIIDALDDYSKTLSETFKVQELVAAKVLEIEKENNHIFVSLRTSKKPKDKYISSISDVKKGDVIRGFVTKIIDKGLFVSIGHNISAYVRVTDLSDSFLKEWKNFFKVHQLVKGRVTEVNAELKRINLTLKDSIVNGNQALLRSFEDLKVNEVMDGVIRSVTDFGVFVKLNGTNNISGLCHKSEIADKEITDIKSLFGEGDKVKVKILKIDPKKKQFSLGLKASYFSNGADEDEEMDDAVEDDNHEEEIENEDESTGDEDKHDNESGSEAESESESESESDGDVDMDNNDISEDEDADEENSDSESSDDEGEPTKIASLSTKGFDWTTDILNQAATNDGESSSDEDEIRDERSKKRRKTHKLNEDKTADLNTKAPQSVSDFERLLIGNPNSSVLWMNYMAFRLQLGDVEKVREIGDRALKTISYREEQEKLNIYIALLNLEHTYGTEETLEDALKRAAQSMDPLTVYNKMANIFIQNERFDKADELYQKMIKKFSKIISVWINYGSFLLDRGYVDRSIEIVQRSLRSLDKRDHMAAVSKFAQLEFNKGSPERGRILFEGLISESPKRLDIWNVYIDHEIKSGDRNKIEQLFERVIAIKQSMKQAKFMFKKWLTYEEKHEDVKATDYVKAKAATYVAEREAAKAAKNSA